MFPEKNSVFDVTIDDVNMLGCGVCRIDGKVCFVKNALPGDSGEITVIKSAAAYCVGKWKEIKKKSPSRREAKCGAYPACGGCAFASLDYAEEARIKTEYVRSEFRKASLDPSLVMPLPEKTLTEGYRNKALIPVARSRAGEAFCGFYAENSHRSVPFGVCSLMPPVFSGIAHGFEKFLNENGVQPYDETTGEGTARHLYLRTNARGETMICAVLSREEGFPKEKFVSFALSFGAKSVFLNVQPRPDNVILGEKCVLLAGEAVLTDTLSDLKFEISPLSFYQVNRACAEELYAAAKALLSLRPDDVLADFYCGTGTIGLTMADSVREVVGIEVVPDAVENARRNAATNGITNARFICADAKEALESLGFSPTAAVIDPPRKGTTNEFIDLIAKTSVDRLAYVSCNPATLARDLARFAERGFVTKTALLFDMFPRTGNVETVVLLSRKEPEMISDEKRNYKSWSNLKNQMNDLLCDSLKGKITYFYTNYHEVHNAYGRATINYNKKELVAFSWVEAYEQDRDTDDLVCEDGGKTNAETLKEKWMPECTLCEGNFIDSVAVFLKTDVAASLHSDNYLLRVFAYMDGRVGKRTLERIRDEVDKLPEWVKRFYHIRCESEKIAF